FHNCSGRLHQFPMHLSWKKGAEVRRKGFLPLYIRVQGEELQRSVVPVKYINHPLFRKLLNEAEEEYGFDQRAAITIPCQVFELHGRMHQFPMHLSWKKGAEVRRKGFLPLYVGAQGEELQRCVVPVKYVNHPLFRKLLNEVEQEYGFNQRAAITIPCQVSELQYVQEVIHKEKHHSHSHQSCLNG
ncbi:hypothetical protein KI387_019457, partial [Taxus chinensis]